MKTNMLNLLHAGTLLVGLVFSLAPANSDAFVIGSPKAALHYDAIANMRRVPTLLREIEDDDGLSQPEQTVYDVLQDMHDSDYPFRLVVIGNGAILETTSSLGPTFKLGKSPKTGEHLTTFASEDQSFEFHLKIAQVSNIVLTEKTGENVMQIFRFVTAEGTPMCSLILADKSEEAQKWFGSMVEKHGENIQP